ncbi:unnamed protein product, partial [Ectocarpus sp. 12 AP-2014]
TERGAFGSIHLLLLHLGRPFVLRWLSLAEKIADRSDQETDAISSPSWRKTGTLAIRLRPPPYFRRLSRTTAPPPVSPSLQKYSTVSPTGGGDEGG